MDKEKAFSFLCSKLLSPHIIKAFVFGSFVTNNENPNDCDIFVVTNRKPYENGWIEFLNVITEIEVDFLRTFDLPLNATINTEKEFTEPSAFRARIFKKNCHQII